ncbi:carboxylesterase family protein [Belliella kenyensis]|uniref:Carboxylic ester hydrolase n=2 Tax=Belliella kenyensis TaxID=1472724 RepID=A0ABV8EMC0_9BACT|nr:carboxylesterase family protein [Belliella kenyensis]MCH7400739.1 carboxylesterase family protein [Belliella kenyensis]
MKEILSLAFIFCVSIYSYALHTIQTPMGQIKTFQEKDVIKVTNIPYAQAKRYEKPKPVQGYDSSINSKQVSPACPQKERPLFSTMFGVEALELMEQSEDCLNLSITRPNNELDSLPVMIWIHGGSYVSGAGDAIIFDPTQLVKDQNVIVVNVTYRLGLLGFLGGYNDIPANLGYLDILEAIKWVNKNIDSFGGDSNKITLFGQSAGGEAIAQMMLIEESRGLFQNVIIQSAPLGLIFNREAMIQDMIKVAKEIPLHAPIDTILNKQEEVLAAAKNYGLQAGMPLGNQYGEDPFPEESELRGIWQKRAREVNILIGYTKEETTFFVPQIPKFRKISNLPVVGGGLKSILVGITTNKVYKKEAKAFARNCSVDENNVYLYEIYWGSKTNGFGATHAIDLPLLFGDSSLWKGAKLVEGMSEEEISDSSKRVCALWAQFARTGKIDSKGRIEGVLKYKEV